MTATPIDIEINGQMYKLSPLTFKDMGELQQWAYDRYQTRLYDQAARITSHVVRDTVISEAVQVRSMEEKERIHDSEIASVDGTIFMLWLMLKKVHKAITIGQVTDMCSDDNISYITRKMGEVNGSADKDDVVPKIESVNQ